MFTAQRVFKFRRFSLSYQVVYKTTSSLSNSAGELNQQMIKFVKQKQYKQALDLFKQSKMHTDVSINMALKACTLSKNYELGKQIEQQLSLRSQQNEFIRNSLLQFYMHCGDMKNAERIYSKITNVSNQMYTILFKGFIMNDKPEKVLDLIDQMKVKPDEYNLTMIFSACAKVKNARAKETGVKLFDSMPHHFKTDIVLLNAALNMLISIDEINRAETLFNSLKRKDVVSYSAMLKGYVEKNMNEKALDLFEQMHVARDNVIYTLVFKTCAQLNNERAHRIGKELLNKLLIKSELGETTQTSAIHMLGNFGNVAGAEQLFKSLKTKDAISYGTMIKCYNTNQIPLKSLQLFKQMKQENIIPTSINFTFLLQACAQIGLPSIAQTIIDQIPPELHNEIHITNGLINLWGKVGSVDQAYSIFKSVKNPDTYTYNIMINAYGLNGRGTDAINLYYQMPHDQWSEISHVVVLNACSHSALVNQARSIFSKINNKTEQIYTTMIDCLSRVQIFDEAEQLIQEYEQLSKQSCLPMHMALLSGARNARNSDLASKIYKKIQEIFPKQKSYLISASILVSNIHMSIGDDEQALIIRQDRLNNHGRKVVPSEATTEDNGELLTFTADDHSHPFSDEIHEEAIAISNELREHGHRFDGSWVTRPLKETETVESVLCTHSERLATAYHFIRGKRPSKIHIVKNLRVCGDCHEATKLIAKIRQCEIVVRDANRIHHFQMNGQCSCNDHF